MSFLIANAGNGSLSSGRCNTSCAVNGISVVRDKCFGAFFTVGMTAKCPTRVIVTSLLVLGAQLLTLAMGRIKPMCPLVLDEVTTSACSPFEK